jgi:hypothetical protein
MLCGLEDQDARSFTQNGSVAPPIERSTRASSGIRLAENPRRPEGRNDLGMQGTFGTAGDHHIQ